MREARQGEDTTADGSMATKVVPENGDGGADQQQRRHRRWANRRDAFTKSAGAPSLIILLNTKSILRALPKVFNYCFAGFYRFSFFESHPFRVKRWNIAPPTTEVFLLKDK